MRKEIEDKIRSQLATEKAENIILLSAKLDCPGIKMQVSGKVKFGRSNNFKELTDKMRAYFYPSVENLPLDSVLKSAQTLLLDGEQIPILRVLPCPKDCEIHLTLDMPHLS